MNEPHGRPYAQKPEDHDFKMRSLFITKIVLAAFGAIITLYFAKHVLLLTFAGLLLSIFITSVAWFIQRYTRLSYRWAWGATLFLLITIFGIGGVLMAPSISRQTHALSQQLLPAFSDLRDQVSRFPFGTYLIQQIQADKLVEQIQAKAASTVLLLTNGLIGILVFLFIGIYGSYEPGLYRRGFLHLLPFSRRKRADQVLRALSSTLRWWLLGRLASMMLVGILTTIGLMVIGIPLAMILGIIAAILDFIPNFGPFIAAIPALLIGMVAGPQKVFSIALLYLAIQLLEGYFITPLIQRQIVKIPPVMLIVFQIFFGIAFGSMGLILATPLAAAVLVLIQKLYVEDTLHDPIGKKGSRTVPA